MYQREQLQQIGIRTAAFTMTSSNNIPSPVRIYDKQLPDLPPPPPPQIKQQWSLQETPTSTTPTSLISPPSNSKPSFFSFNSNNTKGLNIRIVKPQSDINDNNVPTINSDYATDPGDTPLITPQPAPFNVNPNPFPIQTPPQFKQDNSFRTISDSSDSSQSTDDTSSDSTPGDTSSDSVSNETDQHQNNDSEIECVSDELVLSKYGYNIVDTMCDTLHGCIYEAERVETKQDSDDSNHSISAKDIDKPRNSLKLKGKQSSVILFNVSAYDNVVIKKVEKALLKQNANKNKSENEGENIMKEAIILNYLSVLNKPPADNICEFLDLIETNTDLYLIQEYGGDHTLQEFIQTAHGYIQQNKLRLKNWRITVKFIFWQIAVMMYWLHNDMNTCHLDLNVDNISIKNGNFLLHKKDGSITVDSKGLTVKLSDFGFAEIFPFTDDEKDNDSVFQCAKRGITKDHNHKSPQQFNGQTFDARKSDCYSMGVILYEMLSGKKPYNSPSNADDGYVALQTKELRNYLATHGLTSSFKKETLSLVEALVNIDEEERMDTTKIIHHEWFKHYYTRYKVRIEQKTRSQKERHQRQMKKIKALPYYTLNDANTKHCVL